jgi:hypothetical protein
MTASRGSNGGSNGGSAVRGMQPAHRSSSPPTYQERVSDFGNGSQQRSAVADQPAATSELIPNAAPQVTEPLP